MTPLWYFSADNYSTEIIMSQYKNREEVYAIIRFDDFLGPDAKPESKSTVKEIVRSRSLADAEVTRLNNLRKNSTSVRYWHQMTRLYPEGTSAGTAE